jgi:hypothetical protein
MTKGWDQKIETASKKYAGDYPRDRRASFNGSSTLFTAKGPLPGLSCALSYTFKHWTH